MNPTSWNLIQAHQQQERIGWKLFVKGMIAKRWTNIQMTHYRDNPKDGENIYRWRRLVIQAMLNILKEAWGARCGYIMAENIVTEREMLKQRTYDLFLKNRHHLESTPLIDRHLFDKNESYFFYFKSRNSCTIGVTCQRCIKEIEHARSSSIFTYSFTNTAYS